MGQTIADPANSADTIEVFRRAFNCGDALAGTIAALSHNRMLKQGEQIHALSSQQMTMLLLSGKLREVAYGRDGNQLVLCFILPGELFGSVLNMGSTADQGQAEVLEAGKGAQFSDANMLRLMESYSCVAMAVTRQLASRLTLMRRRMVESALLSATGRICAELQRRAAATADNALRPIPVFSEFALSVNSTRETVSRTISQLEKRGILARADGGLKVVAPHRLEEMIF